MDTSNPTKSSWPLAGLVPLLLLACSHDTKRTNPLDPELTPPVELQVALDDSVGTATLTWTPYDGKVPFAGYLVIRIGEMPEVIDTLKIFSDVDETSFVDSTLVTGSTYSYRVSVINSAGLEVPSQPQSVRLLDLAAVEIEEVRFDSRTATATLSWTRYTGSRFRSYRIVRRTGDAPPQLIEEIDDISTTSWVDEELTGNARHRYRVVLLTTANEEIESEERSGVFHEHLDTWPLDMEDGEYVRLYKEGDDIIALISGENRVRLLSFSSGGLLIEEQVLLENPALDIPPHTVALTILPDGTRLVGLSLESFTSSSKSFRLPQLLAYDADGLPLLSDYPLEHGVESFGSSAAEVEGQILLHTHDLAFLDNVRLTSNDRLLIDDEFDGPDHEWEVITGEAEVEGGALRLTGHVGIRRKVTASWHDIRLQADVVTDSSDWVIASITVKADTALAGQSNHRLHQTMTSHTSFGLNLRFEATRDLRSKTLTILPPLDSGLEPQPFDSPFAAATGLTYHLHAVIDEGLIQAGIASPSLWPSENRATDRVIGSMSLVSFEESWAFAMGDSLSRPPGRTLALDLPVSEMRVWETDSEPRIGICVPDQHQVFFAPARLSNGSIWWLFDPSDDPIAVGTRGQEPGQEPGGFFYPLSFDVGIDGRMFVLDAGNRRIQAFDSEGNYITHWGNEGTDDGQFDFRGGLRPEDFSGSIVVDDEGFIYVADVGNERIQKFAP